jgi:hypothetical protein
MTRVPHFKLSIQNSKLVGLRKASTNVNFFMLTFFLIAFVWYVFGVCFCGFGLSLGGLWFVGKVLDVVLSSLVLFVLYLLVVSL